MTISDSIPETPNFIYNKTSLIDNSNGTFTVPVARNLYMRSDYIDSMYAKILRSPLGEKKYEYSDLGYYFIKKI